MPIESLQTKRTESRKCNEQVLLQAGFVKIRNSSLYKKGEKTYILSPGIGKGKHEKYWFDVRANNLEKINTSSDTKTWMLLRIVPNWFAFFPFFQLNDYLNLGMQEYRSHSGKVWGFYCDLNEEMRTIKIKPKNNTSSSMDTDLLNLNDAVSALSQI